MATAGQKNAIFREKALQKYIQNQEKGVLPHFIPPRVLLFSWIVLLILTGVGILAWLGQVPQYADGPGIVLASDAVHGQVSHEVVAAIPLSVRLMPSVRIGSSVHLHIGPNGLEFSGTVDSVASTILSPGDVQRRYGIAVTEPAQIIFVRLGPDASWHIYIGSSILAQVQIGSRRLLTLFPVFDSLLKD